MPRAVVGLIGMVLAAMLAQLNDQVVSSALPDIMGGLAASRDEATWLRTVYIVGEVVGMATAPSLGLIFSFRRFALFGIALSCLSAVLSGLCTSIGPVLALRVVQGLASGFIIPLLLTTALRVLSPETRLYGLIAYALTTTFTPTLATTLAALWVDGLEDWRFAFFEALPIAAVAATLVWWGMQQDPPQLGRLAGFDWVGALLVAIGFGSLAVVLEQGDRLDWYNSDLIAVLTLISAVAIPLFILNELRVEVPLVRLDLLRRPNFAYPILALMLFIVISLGATEVPVAFLSEVRGYRPLQAHLVTLEVSLSQLLLLPLMSLVLNIRWVDARWTIGIGLSAILIACIGCSFMSPDWARNQFLGWQALQSIGFAMVSMSILTMVTNTVKPDEGPFASAMVNTPRAIAEALGIWLLALIGRWRGATYRTRIVETLGSGHPGLQRGPAFLGVSTPSSGTGVAGTLRTLDEAIEAQVRTLVTIDTYVVLAGLVVLLIVLLLLVPTRTYPPRIALAKH